MTPSGIAALIISLVLGAFLAFPALGWSAAGPPRPASAVAGFWLLLNFFVWMAPAWRTHIVTNRGPLLGFGFAFAGALVSSAVDGLAAGFQGALLLFLWRGLLLSLPFALALARRRKPYPHWSDLAVLAYAWLLPHVPGFGGAWFFLEEAGSAGLFGTGGAGLELGPGRLLGLALISTYFYGARAWSAAPLDWMLREKDAAAAVRMAFFGAALALLAHFALQSIGMERLAGLIEAPVGRTAWAFFVFGVTLAPVAEELAFRGLLQSGIAKMAPKKYAARRHFATASALLVALLHASLGAFGLAPGAAFGLSLGISLAYARTNRLLPAVLAHGAAFALLALLSVWL